MIIIINGAPGSGKSKTAELLNKTTPNSAWIDGDWLLRINPRTNSDSERDLRYEQIANVARTYHDHGYKNVFISFVYFGPIGLKHQIEFLNQIDEVKVFALAPSDESLSERHAGDSSPREDIYSSVEINTKLRSLTGVEFIDNSNLSVEETVELIKAKI